MKWVTVQEVSLPKAKTQVGLGNTHSSLSCAQQFRGESSPLSIKEPENKLWPIDAVENFLALGGKEALITGYSLGESWNRVSLWPLPGPCPVCDVAVYQRHVGDCGTGIWLG